LNVARAVESRKRDSSLMGRNESVSVASIGFQEEPVTDRYSSIESQRRQLDANELHSLPRLVRQTIVHELTGTLS
jgi:hypothetical protein